MRFTTENPPRTVYYDGPGTPFDVILEVRNRGTHNVVDGYFYLTGYDRNIIQPEIIVPSGQNLPMPFSLDGVTNFNPEGDITTVEFRNTILRWPEGTDSYAPGFRATACYEYRTVANPVVCIDPHPFSSLSEDKPCRVRNILMTGGQGAPIEVTMVEEEATEQYVYFKIHIRNAQAKGVVYDYTRVSPSSQYSCPFNIQYADINRVHYFEPQWVGNDNFNPRLISCKPDSPLRLVDNKAVIYCKYSIPQGLDEVYQTPLNIVLRYGYMNYEEQRITIKNVAE